MDCGFLTGSFKVFKSLLLTLFLFGTFGCNLKSPLRPQYSVKFNHYDNGNRMTPILQYMYLYFNIFSAHSQ